jgi:hypothetical protein
VARTTKREVDEAKALADSSLAYLKKLISDKEKAELKFLKEIALAQRENEHLNQQYVLTLRDFKRGE